MTIKRSAPLDLHDDEPASTALTERQQQVLAFVAEQMAAHGRPPSLREIATALRLPQHSSAQACLDALVRRGLIERAGGHRGLRVLPAARPWLPDSELSESDPLVARAARLAEPAMRYRALYLPLVGRVAAGSPVMADGNIEARFQVDPALFRPRPHYLLRVEGDSMIGAGIHNADLIAVHRTQVAEAGQIVVARLDDEITVKRLARHGDSWRLLAENPAYAPIDIDPARTDSFAIEGLHVGVIRRA